MDILIYIGMLLAKIIEVTLATTRIVLITKGERVKGAIIGFFEITIWLLLISTVLTNVSEDPMKLVIYALGFSIGNYAGSRFEERLGVGTTRIEAIVRFEQGKALADDLRSMGYAVTVVEGQGMNHKRNVLILHVPRKKAMKIVDEIKRFQENVVVTVNEVKPIYGGYGILKK